MKLPISWLEDFVKINNPAERLAEDLQLSGTKVESIENISGDTVFDFEITPNRADCLSVIGVAREIAAIYKEKLTVPDVFTDTSIGKDGKKVELTVTENKLCPFYSLGVIDNIRVGSSPSWLVSRLEKSGVRSINNIVDVTNYVMIETGQPMHAFDYDKIKGKMRLRSSLEGEKIVTLDGIGRDLPAGAIIIEDEEKIIDLAGLMGSESSEVSTGTETVVLHVPLYDPLSIRRTSASLGLRSEASNRFEKKLDPIGHRYAFERSVHLIQTIVSGRLTSSIKSVNYPVRERSLLVPESLIRNVLGLKISGPVIIDILKRLGFAVNQQTSTKEKILKVIIPTFRTDIEDPIDITEEVGRIYGYNNFPRVLPVGSPPIETSQQINFEKQVKEALSSVGLKEIYSSSLTSGQVLDNFGLSTQETLKISNRLVIDFEYLRPTLLIGLVEAAALNVANFDRFSLFETGKVFSKEKKAADLYYQPNKIGAVFVGRDFAEAKGILETALKKLSISDLRFEKTESKGPLGVNSANVFSGSKLLGFFGDVEGTILNKIGITAPVFAFELDQDSLESMSTQPFYHPIHKFPTLKENISLFLPDSLPFARVYEAVKSAAGKNFYSLELLEDTRLGNKRAVLLGVEYFAQRRTLDKADIAKIRKQVLDELVKIGVIIREGKAN
ncbi:MAG: phenylalanine--tRNA ligase subunit beta [bacterium]|nr:phenylalanine--tRNA ligase subunit beta [bacterium]